MTALVERDYSVSRLLHERRYWMNEGVVFILDCSPEKDSFLTLLNDEISNHHVN